LRLSFKQPLLVTLGTQYRKMGYLPPDDYREPLYARQGQYDDEGWFDDDDLNADDASDSGDEVNAFLNTVVDFIEDHNNEPSQREIDAFLHGCTEEQVEWFDVYVDMKDLSRKQEEIERRLQSLRRRLARILQNLDTRNQDRGKETDGDINNTESYSNQPEEESLDEAFFASI
jgi:hypothetical protein